MRAASLKSHAAGQDGAMQMSAKGQPTLMDQEVTAACHYDLPQHLSPRPGLGLSALAAVAGGNVTKVDIVLHAMMRAASLKSHAAGQDGAMQRSAKGQTSLMDQEVTAACHYDLPQHLSPRPCLGLSVLAAVAGGNVVKVDIA